MTLSMGSSIFASFNSNLHQAKLEVAYQTLMRTEYGYHELPGVLHQHGVSGACLHHMSVQFTCPEPGPSDNRGAQIPTLDRKQRTRQSPLPVLGLGLCHCFQIGAQTPVETPVPKGLKHLLRMQVFALQLQNGFVLCCLAWRGFGLTDL